MMKEIFLFSDEMCLCIGKQDKERIKCDINEITYDMLKNGEVEVSSFSKVKSYTDSSILKTFKYDPEPLTEDLKKYISEKHMILYYDKFYNGIMEVEFNDPRESNINIPGSLISMDHVISSYLTLVNIDSECWDTLAKKLQRIRKSFCPLYQLSEPIKNYLKI